MTWVKLPQEYADRSEIMLAGRDAAWLHTAALVYCAKFLTDGLVPAAAIYGLAMGPDAPELAARLVAVGLWYPADGGYYIPDYLAWNPSRERKAELSASRATNGRAGGVRSGTSRREAKAKQNASQIAEQNAEQNGSKNEANSEASGEARIPYPVSRDPVSREPVAIHRTIPARDRDRDPHAHASAHEGAGGLAMPKEWYNRTWREFVAGYGKAPPKGLAQRWPGYCPNEAIWLEIQAGLARWKVSRAWLDNNPNGDMVTKAETWLADKMYLWHPAPLNPETANAESQGRAGGDGTPRAKTYAIGDPDDPYWAENHGLLSEVRQRKRDLAAGKPVPDDGRTGVRGNVPAVPGRGVAQA